MKKPMYEIMIALDPAVMSEDADALMEKVKGQIAEAGGELKSIEKQGSRRLAYKIRGKQEANFFLMTCEAPPKTISQATQALRLHEGVLRFMATRLDERLPAAKAARSGGSAN